MGALFGGCVVALIERAQAGEIMDRFRRDYFAATGMDAEMFVTKAAGGPQVV